MKRLKRIIALILVVSLVSGVQIGYSREVKAQDIFAITSPVASEMKAAGYIDIQWTSAASGGTVKNYSVYVDGKLAGSTTGQTYTYYTTEVKYHNVWVKADYTNGASAYTATRQFGITKKGLAVNDQMGKYLDPVSMNMGWYYTWGTTPFSYTRYNQIEFVPMIWGTQNNSSISAVRAKNYQYVLGYNEPDMGGDVGGSNIKVNTAIANWGLFKGVGRHVGSPAPALCPAWDNGTWFKTFMDGVDHNTIDFIPLHCYYGQYGGKAGANTFLKEVVDATYQMYHKPIWVTEFAVSGWGYNNASARQSVKEFLQTAIDGLNQRDYVERFSWFSFNTTDGNNGASALWTNSTGNLTELGRTYVDYGNPVETAAQGSAVNPGATQTSAIQGPNQNPNGTNGTGNTVTVKRAAIKSLKNLKTRKAKITIKKIAGVAGYQVRWCDNRKFQGYEQKTIKKRTLTIKRLDKKATYFFKVRAYKKNGNKKVWGKWSKVKKVKIKK